MWPEQLDMCVACCVKFCHVNSMEFWFICSWPQSDMDRYWSWSSHCLCCSSHSIFQTYEAGEIWTCAQRMSFWRVFFLLVEITDLTNSTQSATPTSWTCLLFQKNSRTTNSGTETTGQAKKATQTSTKWTLTTCFTLIKNHRDTWSQWPHTNFSNVLGKQTGWKPISNSTKGQSTDQLLRAAAQFCLGNAANAFLASIRSTHLCGALLICEFFTSQQIKYSSMELSWFAPGVVQTGTKVNITRQVENGTQIRTFLTDWFCQFPYWCLILNPKQICRPNMNTMENQFHRETAVCIFW